MQIVRAGNAWTEVPFRVTMKMMALFLLTLGAIAIVMAIMAIGVMLDGRCLRGSCGGPDVTSPDGESLTCATCPHRSGSAAAEG